MLLPGCVIKQLDIADRQDPVLAATPRYCLQVFRPDSDSGASSIWLAADSETEFAEWKEMLHIAANKRRSQVNEPELNLYEVRKTSFLILLYVTG